LQRDCLLKHITEGKIEGGIAVMDRQERRCKQILHNLKKMRECLKLKEKVLNCTL
jgi:hypothetical protein